MCRPFKSGSSVLSLVRSYTKPNCGLHLKQVWYLSVMQQTYIPRTYDIPDQQEQCCQCLSVCAAGQSASANSPVHIIPTSIYPHTTGQLCLQPLWDGEMSTSLMPKYNNTNGDGSIWTYISQQVNQKVRYAAWLTSWQSTGTDHFHSDDPSGLFL